MILFIITLCASVSCRKRSEMLKIRFWHSYTGSQSEVFQKLVDDYNNTVGRQRGVEIIAYYKGNAETLSGELENLPLNELPNIISVSGEDAYSAYLKNKIVCAEDYLSPDVLDGYPGGILNAGRFTYSTGIYYFPISSVIGILFVNSGIMNEFAQSQYVSINNLETWDGIYSLASEYYEWSEGKPFIAINDIGAYIQTVSKQNMASVIQSGGRGIDIVFNAEVMRKIWDFYHGGFIRGYISEGNERADQLMESGDLVCVLGTTSDAWTTPIWYTDGNGDVQYLEMVACKYPQNAQGDSVIPVSTEGAVVLNKDKTQCQESYVFLNWLDNNREMSKVCTTSKGLPVSHNVFSDGTVLEEMDSFISAGGRNRGITSVYSEAYGIAASASLYSPAIFNGRTDFESEISASLINASLRDRQTCLERIGAGEDPDTVFASFDSEELFREWLSQLENIKSRY